MRIRLLPIIIAAVIGLTAQANAARQYYLVGLRHVYMFDVWPDTHKLDRQAIEEEYSAALSSGQQLYDADMTSIREEETKDGGMIHQIDRDAVQQNLEQAIAEAAETRDANLGQLYVECDYVRATHPEFQVDQDGPYQVMGCDVTPDGDFQYVCFYKPYPLYAGPCPYGWDWEHPYPFMSFGLEIRLYHTTWLSIGSPVFTPMYHGGEPVRLLAPIRMNVIVNRSSWAGGHPPSVTEEDRQKLQELKELQRKAGIRPPSTHPGVTRVRAASPIGIVSRYSHVKPIDTVEAAQTSRYSHPITRMPPPVSTGSGSRVKTTTGGTPVHTGGRARGTGNTKSGGDKKKGTE